MTLCILVRNGQLGHDIVRFCCASVCLTQIFSENGIIVTNGNLDYLNRLRCHGTYNTHRTFDVLLSICSCNTAKVIQHKSQVLIVSVQSGNETLYTYTYVYIALAFWRHCARYA